MITGKNYIGNELSSQGLITYKTINPETNSENETIFYEATREEVDKAMELATKAFKTYKKISDIQKADFLEAIASEMEAIEEDLIEIYIKESGLPAGRARGEFARTAGQLRSFATMLREGSYVEVIISKSDEKFDIRRMLIPIGPVAIFGASNFPFAFSTAGGDTASALAAGCPVVVKSHPMHAGTGELVSSAIIKAAKITEMPNGIFSNLNSSGIEIGKVLVQHPAIKAVGFTGSFNGGMALFKIAAERKEPIPVYAEMGSINPVVILPSALKSKGKYWAEQYASSITQGTGQFCTSPGLILGISGKDFDNFISILNERIEETEPTCMLHPSIKKKYDEMKSNVLSQRIFSNIGTIDNSVKENYAQPNIITVKGADFLENKTFHKEVFGPFSVIVQCEDKEELIEIIQNLEGQLTGTVLCENPLELGEFTEATEALKDSVGRIIFNNVPTGVEVCAAMTHGGPFPASSDSKFTSVGLTAVKRWIRPVSYQDWPNALLPEALKNKNPLGIFRSVNGELTKNIL